jgi:hypothetical protein
MAGRGRLSESQIAVEAHLEAAGHGYHCSSEKFGDSLARRLQS